MSVPKSARQTSSMEYIANCRRICAELFAWSNQLPKRYAFRLLNPLCDHAAEALYHLKAANRTYVRDRETFEQRRGHLLAAEGHIDHVETMLDILYDVRRRDYDEQVGGLATDGERARVRRPGYGKFAELADLVESQRKLVSGVKRRDTDAYTRMQQDSGQDRTGAAR